ncbi:hypothetical protein IV500_20380 [Paeniglutamicibacter antarcticus]|uniref:ParB-like C-terminal domain-containing protein n=1 Tax=Arthrobacter terrae TaxID=2935737 RepID=A0A931GCH2_9MICC|nr:hypothetical protein [Arthrobacter terrae]MBG0741717.1 hypothetical protein [Arthrobacter terrae]
MSRKKPSSFAPYFTRDDADQVRAAFLAAGHVEGYASISELIEAATLKEVRRLQRKHHNSKPWEGAGPGALRPGQRTRTEQNTERKNTQHNH